MGILEFYHGPCSELGISPILIYEYSKTTSNSRKFQKCKHWMLNLFPSNHFWIEKCNLCVDGWLHPFSKPESWANLDYQSSWICDDAVDSSFRKNTMANEQEQVGWLRCFVACKVFAQTSDPWILQSHGFGLISTKIKTKQKNYIERSLLNNNIKMCYFTWYEKTWICITIIVLSQSSSFLLILCKLEINADYSVY